MRGAVEWIIVNRDPIEAKLVGVPKRMFQRSAVVKAFVNDQDNGFVGAWVVPSCTGRYDGDVRDRGVRFVIWIDVCAACCVLDDCEICSNTTCVSIRITFVGSHDVWWWI